MNKFMKKNKEFIGIGLALAVVSIAFAGARAFSKNRET